MSWLKDLVSKKKSTEFDSEAAYKALVARLGNARELGPKIPDEVLKDESVKAAIVLLLQASVDHSLSAYNTRMEAPYTPITDVSIEDAAPQLFNALRKAMKKAEQPARKTELYVQKIESAIDWDTKKFRCEQMSPDKAKSMGWVRYWDNQEAPKPKLKNLYIRFQRDEKRAAEDVKESGGTLDDYMKSYQEERKARREKDLAAKSNNTSSELLDKLGIQQNKSGRGFLADDKGIEREKSSQRPAREDDDLHVMNQNGAED